MLEPHFLRPLIVLLAANAVACIAYNDPPRTRFDAPFARGATDWSSILSAPSPITEFRALHTGDVQVPLSGPLNLAHPRMQGAVDEDVYVQVYAFRFCHRDQGCVLIDTGLDASFQAGGNLHGLIATNYIRNARQTPGQDIGSQLTKFSEPLRAVFFTHLHGDHTAGAPALAPDLAYYAGESEEYINYWLLYHGDHLHKVRTLRSLNPAQGRRIGPIEHAIDVFGDGSFFALSTPGHSRGHLSYVVVADTGAYLLTGDASHTWRGFNENIEPGWTVNREQMIASLSQLRALAAEQPTLRIALGHELAPNFF